jgi:type IV pilus assembly protein PilC
MNQNINPNSADNTLVLNITNDDTLTQQAQKKSINLLELFNLINDYLIDSSTVALQDKLIFFQLLGAMNSAGLPVIESLILLEKQTKNPKMQHVILDIKTTVEQGESLAFAMKRNDDVFDEATCSVVEAGEKSGKLNDVLKELVSQYEQISTLTKKIKAVMMYPIIVIVVMILLIIIVLLVVVPKLEDLFGGAENLPLPTKILINSSNFVIDQWYILLGIIIGGGFMFANWKKSSTGSKQWGNFLLNMPISGSIMKKMILTRFTRIFGFLIGAGVPIVEGLKISANIAQNELYKEKLLLAADDLTKGITIAENLSDDEKLFPPMIVNMIAIGEKTASIDKVMGKAADFYNEELERAVGSLSKVMEPVILMFIAGGAIFMILAIYLPILQMNDKIMG